MGKVNLYRKDRFKYKYKSSFNHFSGQFITAYIFSSTEKEVTYNFYLKRENEEIATDANIKKFKKMGIEYFSDCETIKEMFETNEFRKYFLKEIVDQYNVFYE